MPIVLIGVLVAATSGCAVGAGQSVRNAEGEVDNLRGFRDARIDTVTLSQTFGSKMMLNLRVRTDGIPHDDRARVAERLLEIVYSVREWKPTSGISVRVSGSEGAPIGRASRADRWVGIADDDSTPGEFFVIFPGLRKELGTWPGPMPC